MQKSSGDAKVVSRASKLKKTKTRLDDATSEGAEIELGSEQ
jgi:hypothetical protein